MFKGWKDENHIPTINWWDVLCKTLDQPINNHICLKNLTVVLDNDTYLETSGHSYIVFRVLKKKEKHRK